MTMKEKQTQSLPGESAYFPKATTVAKYMKTGQSTKVAGALSAPARITFSRALRGFAELHDRTERLLDEHDAVDRAAVAALQRTRVLLSE